MNNHEKSRERVCFVIGPIGKENSPTRKHADLLLKGIVRESIASNFRDIKVIRSDEESDPGLITEKIINRIIHSDIVIADLTELNPNVFYELGIRHATGRVTIAVAMKGTELPFDNIGQRTIFYDPLDYDSMEMCRTQIFNYIRASQEDGYIFTNIVTQAGAILDLKNSPSERDRLISSLYERMSNIENLLRNIKNDHVEKSAILEIVHFDASEISAGNVARFAIDIRSYFTVGDFLDGVFYAITRINPSIRPFQYGIQWVLVDPSGQVVETTRTRTNDDDRPLEAAGITADKLFKVCRPKL